MLKCLVYCLSLYEYGGGKVMKSMLNFIDLVDYRMILDFQTLSWQTVQNQRGAV